MGTGSWSRSSAAVRRSSTCGALVILAALLALHGCGEDRSGGAEQPVDAATEQADAETPPSDAGQEDGRVDEAAVERLDAAQLTDAEAEADVDADELDGGELDAEEPSLAPDANEQLEDAAGSPDGGGEDAMAAPGPGLSVLIEQTPPTTSESGARFTFRLALRTAPSARVIVPIAVSDEQEAEALTSSVTFTTADWSAPKLVSIEGKDDTPPVRDGPVTYEITIGPTISVDADYRGITVEPIAVVNQDDDTPAVRVTPDLQGQSELLETSETGRTARLSLGLRTRPRAAVTIPVASSNEREGLVNVSSVTIEPSAWSGVHWITLTGVDDLPPVVDGNTPYEIRLGPTTSADPDYDELTIESVPARNEDDDAPALLVTSQQTPLLTTELGTTALWIDVRLLTQPLRPVRVPVQSSLPGEATPDISELMFDANSWSVPQRIHVRGIADGRQDGLQPYAITLGPTESSDARYEGLASSVPGQNYDVDTPDVLVTYQGELKTSERGTKVALNIQLTKQPTADVIVPLAIVRAPGGASDEGTIATPTPLTFTTSNYNAVRTIEIVGVNDATIDGDQPYFLRVGPTMSSDPAYLARALPDIALINEDDDSAALVVTPIGAVDGRLTLYEPGPGFAEFGVRLQTAPAAPVQVTFTSSDLTEGTPPPPLQFVASAPSVGQWLWSDEQIVRVAVRDDDAQDGPVDFHIRVRAESSDPDYDTTALDQLVVVRTFDDGDSAGLRLGPGIVPPSLLSVLEPNGTRTLTVRLTSMPSAPVTIPIVSSDLTEGRLSENGAPIPTSGIVIQPAAWDMERTLTLTSVQDDIADGNQSYQVSVGPTSSLDRLYQNKSAVIAAVTEDADTPGIIYDGVVLPPGFAVVTHEVGSPVAPPLRLRLTSKPTAPVTVAVSIAGPDADEATVSPARLTFTESDWDLSSAHQVVVSGVDDAVDDGDRTYSIVFAPAESTDLDYAGLAPAPAALRGLNTDDADSLGVNVSGGPLALFEEGTEQEIEVVLRSQPTAPVTIGLRTTEGSGGDADPAAASLLDGDGAERSTAELVFQPASWNRPQRVTVRGMSDMVRLGHRSIALAFTVASLDESYDGLALPDVVGTVYDVPRTCKSALELWPLTATGTGEYEIDTDLDPTTPWHFAHCDMESDGGGWTLLAYSGDTATYGGVPYPGQDSVSAPYCLVGAGSAIGCSRGSGLPRADLPGLLEVSTEFAQSRAATGSPPHDPYARRIVDYAFAGRFYYGAVLARLELEYSAGTCTPLAAGTYFDIVGTAELDGTTVHLAQALRSPISSNYASINNSYAFSVGTPGSACTMSSAPPASYLGTWQTGQYGPGASGEVGSFALWVR